MGFPFSIRFEQKKRLIDEFFIVKYWKSWEFIENGLKLIEMD